MKAITVKQPWADAILLFGKCWENRSWVTNYRGKLAIHAGLGWDQTGVDFIKRIHSHRISDVFFQEATKRKGMIVGITDLVGCFRLSDQPKGSFGPWATGPNCWKLNAPRTLLFPIVISGAQGLWNVPEPTERMIWDLLGEKVAKRVG